MSNSANLLSEEQIEQIRQFIERSARRQMRGRPESEIEDVISDATLGFFVRINSLTDLSELPLFALVSESVRREVRAVFRSRHPGTRTLDKRIRLLAARKPEEIEIWSDGFEPMIGLPEWGQQSTRESANKLARLLAERGGFRWSGPDISSLPSKGLLSVVVEGLQVLGGPVPLSGFVQALVGPQLPPEESLAAEPLPETEDPTSEDAERGLLNRLDFVNALRSLPLRLRRVLLFGLGPDELNYLRLFQVPEFAEITELDLKASRQLIQDLPLPDRQISEVIGVNPSFVPVLRRRAKELMLHALEQEQKGNMATREPSASKEVSGAVPPFPWIQVPAESRSDVEQPTDGGTLFPVWFGTNRMRVQSALTSQRGLHTVFGRVDVRIPKAHRFGEIGSGFLRRLSRLDLRDDRLCPQNTSLMNQIEWFRQINAYVAEARRLEPEKTQALVFIHGYNVTFEGAAIRAAQLGCDLHVLGPTAFFSWPSKGTLEGYLADEATIEASESAITHFLVDFANRCEAADIHIVAHSMGNRGFLRALQRISAEAALQSGVRFGQFFLAAPDIDRDVFLELAKHYPIYCKRATLYASSRDLAVNTSAKIHMSPRAGYFEPYTVAPEVDTVAVPNFNVDLLGHSYFAQAEALLYDMIDLMRSNTEPAMRPRIESASWQGMKFWRLRR